MCDEQRTLAEIVEHQPGRGNAEPRDADRPLAEVTHVRVERLRAGDRKQHRTQHDERRGAVSRHEMQRVRRIDRLQNRRRLGDVPDPDCADRNEPDGAHGTEEQADDTRAMPLDREQCDENTHRDLHDVRFESRGPDLQPLNRRKHRDRGRQHCVTIEQ